MTSKIHARATWLLGALLTGVALQAIAEDASLSARYATAERYLAWNRGQVLNAPPAHQWQGEVLTFRRDAPAGRWRFLKIDPKAGREEPAFDHALIAEGLSRAGIKAAPDALPFRAFSYEESGRAISFEIGPKSWSCALQTAQCSSKAAPPRGLPREIPSPDGRFAAFAKGDDIWVRETSTGQERPLTKDGAPHNAYGARSANNTEAVSDLRSGLIRPPLLVWSPDSKRIITHQLDEREVGEMHLIASNPGSSVKRPKAYTYRYSLAGDAQKPKERLVIVDVASGAAVAVAQPPIETLHQTALEERYVWWSRDSQSAYVIARGDYSKTLTLRKISAESGQAETLIEETSDTFAEIAEEGRTPRVRVLASGDIIWFSERSGNGHLYLFGQDGRLKRKLTSGSWNVLEILRVDEDQGVLIFNAVGREPGQPLQRRVYKVGLDGRGLKLLTPEPMDHEVRIAPQPPFEFAKGGGFERRTPFDGFSASGRYFVETYSDPQTPPTTVLRGLDGRRIATLATADISAFGARAPKPEPFCVLAADGVTPLYGTLFKPSDFDPSKRYPIVDSLYPGPQMQRVQQAYIAAIFDPFEAQSLAELGFIVITLDGRGTPHRSKAFLAQSYGRLGDGGGLADHAAALKTLAADRPYMDLGRVGAVGHSGGGFAAARAIFAYPELYKVAVASAGNHDQRLYVSGWGEVYNGPDVGSAYDEADNTKLAAKLQGKLLLAHGEMDDNVSPAQTLRLADALIDAGKTFDLLIIPGANHGLLADGRPNRNSAYFVRRRWDHLVRHLLGEEPPAYQIKTQ